MAHCEEYSSFFATSFLNLKAQNPNGGSRLTAPTAEERQLLNCNSYGTFAIPFGTFRRPADDAAATLYRRDSGLQAASLSEPSTTIVAASSTTTITTPSHTASDDASATSASAESSVRGLTSCRESYANYGTSILGERWDSGAYQFENSGRAGHTKLVATRTPTTNTSTTTTKTSTTPTAAMRVAPAVPKPTTTTTKMITTTKFPLMTRMPAVEKRGATLPAILPIPKCPPRGALQKPIHIVKAPTPPAIELDFSCDDNDEMLPDENKTQQFFRLAQQHRDQRVHLMEKYEREQRRRTRSNTVTSLPAGGHGRFESEAASSSQQQQPAAALSDRVVKVPQPPRGPYSEPRPDRNRFASVPTAKNEVQRLLMHAASPPPSFNRRCPPALPQHPSQSAAAAVESQNVNYTWFINGLNNDSNTHFHFPARTTTTNNNTATATASANAKAAAPAAGMETETVDGSASSSGSSSLSRSCSSASSTSSAVPLNDRELWGVCPRRDFAVVKSPVWAALDNPHYRSGGNSSADGEGEEDDRSSASDGDSISVADSEIDANDSDDDTQSAESVVDRPLMDEDEDDAQSENGGYGEVVVATPPPVSSAYQALMTRLGKAVRSTGTNSTRSEVSMHALKVHRGSDFTSTINSTANLSDSASNLSSGVSAPRQAHDSRHGASPTRAVRSSPELQFQYDIEEHSEEAVQHRERNGTKVHFRPRTPPRGELVPVGPMRYRRANGFRRIFKGFF